MAHVHDSIDWPTWLAALRRADALNADATAAIAARLTAGLPADPAVPVTVVDAGSGGGGMSVAFARALAGRSAATVVLVDATPELLAAATEATKAVGTVAVRAVEADAADPGWTADLPPADVVWAAGMVHHLPDQQAGVDLLAAAVAPGGVLALGEGGLQPTFLPWDIGVGTPGLETRLQHAQGRWFHAMRTGMAGHVAMPYGWTTALGRAGLRDVGSFGALMDHPAPPTPAIKAWVVDYLERFVGVGAGEYLDAEDRSVLDRLLDPEGPDAVTRREDLHVLAVHAVHHGTRPPASG